jgi:hypothetical protein
MRSSVAFPPVMSRQTGPNPHPAAGAPVLEQEPAAKTAPIIAETRQSLLRRRKHSPGRAIGLLRTDEDSVQSRLHLDPEVDGSLS